MASKHNNKFLGAAEIPKSVEEFLSKTGGVPMQLLLLYIEELEKLNKELAITNAHHKKMYALLEEKVERLDTAILRLENKRVTKDWTEEELQKKAREVAERSDQKPWKTGPKTGARKFNAGKSKGQFREIPKKG